MYHKDESDDFLQSLPEVKTGEKFQFACHPGVNCFNACCGDLNLMLTPYDALRLRKALDLSSKDFIEGHSHVLVAPDTGFPSLRLRMTDGKGKPCPYVRPEGCSVYMHRPGACRTYPIGRASRLDGDGGIIEQFFLVQEPHCKGFGENRHWTTDEWLTDQGLEPYNESNDRYVRLLARQKKTGTQISARHATMAFMALYQLDNFQRFLKEMGVFKRLDVSEERQQLILANEEEALRFAFDWVELVIFGECETLRKLD